MDVARVNYLCIIPFKIYFYINIFRIVYFVYIPLILKTPPRQKKRDLNKKQKWVLLPTDYRLLLATNVGYTALAETYYDHQDATALLLLLLLLSTALLRACNSIASSI